MNLLLYVKELNPLLPKNYFTNFLCEKVALRHKFQLDHNVRLYRKYYVLLFVFVNCFRNFMFRFTSDNEITNIIWFDILRIARINPLINDIFIMFYLQIYIMYKFLHFNFKWSMTKLLYTTILLKQMQMFPKQSHNGKNISEWLESIMLYVKVFLTCITIWFGKIIDL